MSQQKLHLVDATTGEIVAPEEQDDRDLVIEQLQGDIRGKNLAIGKLKRELRDLRAVEPDAQEIRDVLGYWRGKCKPRAVIAPGGQRWEKVRARLREKLEERDPWTPAELRLAVDGALLDPWISGRDPRAKGKGFVLEATTIFRDSESVEKLLSLAVGFTATAGIGVGELLEVSDQLRLVGWKTLLRICVCDHRRLEHSRPDPDRGGQEGCLAPGCECEDFHLDVFDHFNQRADEHLRRHFGRSSG